MTAHTLTECRRFADAVTAAGGSIPPPLAGLLSTADLLMRPSATRDPVKGILAAARAGQLDQKTLDRLIADAAQQDQIGKYRQEVAARAERLLVEEFGQALKSGAADQLLDSLRPAWDAAAEAIAAARTQINAESTADHILASAQPSVITAWQHLSENIAVIARISAIASQFGCRTGNFPLVTEFAHADGFRLEDRAIFCTDGPLPIDSGVFRQPDQGHRTSPFFRLPLRLHSVESAQARYNAWAADEFDRLHSGPTESWIDEQGHAHQKSKPRNPFREKAAAT